jgi:hypothetical protein
VRARFEAPGVRSQLQAVGIRRLSDLLAFQRLSPPSVDAIAAATELANTDDNHFVEYQAPRDMFYGARVDVTNRLDERLYASPSLFWSAYVRAYPEPDAALSALAALEQENVRIDAVTAVLQVAAHHLDPALLDQPARAEAHLLPASLWGAPPPAPAALASRIDAQIAAGRADLAAQVLDAYAPSILVASALSAPQAELWLERSLKWMSAGVPSFLRFRTELLMAARQPEGAAALLGAWIRQPEAPPGDWAALRACQIDPGAFCRQVFESYASSR